MQYLIYSLFFFQDNYNSSMYDGSQEVSSGRAELHSGDRKLWVERSDACWTDYELAEAERKTRTVSYVKC